ncbi:MAG: efflux RND transporter permease subunit [Pseudomonadota bacterium]
MIIDTHRGIIAWFARNHVAANLLMIVLVLAGLTAVITMRTQVNPSIEPNRITIDIPYPGASPGEVESAVVQRVEEAVADIEGIEEMRSYSRDGFGQVHIMVESDFDVQVVLDEVKLAVDRIASLPGQAERPVISRALNEVRAIAVQLYGDLDERGLKSLAHRVREEVLALPSVSKAELAGARPYQVSIEVTESALRQYGLTLEDVARAIRTSSIDLGAGTIRTDAGDILLRTQGQAYSERDFADLVLLSTGDGTRLTLADIARVDDGFAEQAFYSYYNGQPSIGINVFAIGDQNQIDISREVRAYVADKQSKLPEGIHIDTFLDSTEYLSGTLNMMMSNMLSGVLLVLIVLGIFLRFKLAFWVMLGMPIAFLGAFALLPLTGGSINMLSLFGFILVLGIVVDDAIIIGESVQTSLDNEGYSIDAVIRGARRVAVPATFGVLTTIATFLPLLFVPGSFGALPAAIGWVVILCLIFSLVESKLILPAHLASLKPPRVKDLQVKRLANLPARSQQYMTRALHRLIHDYYMPVLDRAIRIRYITTAAFLGMLILSIGFTAGPYVRTVMFPDMTMDYVVASIEMAEGTSANQTINVVAEVTSALQALEARAPDDGKFVDDFIAYTFGANGNVMVDLRQGPDVSPEEVAAAWRAEVGEIVGTKKLEISGSQKSHGGRGDISFKLLGGNVDQLKGAAALLQQHLRQYDGLHEIENNAQGVIPEMDIRIRPAGESLGLTLGDLASQVRAAFYGVEAQRLQRDGEEIRVLVRYPESDRQSLGNLEGMYVRTPAGELVPFSVVAEIRPGVSPSVVTRIDGDRSVEVSANLDATVTRSADVVRDVMTGAFRTELAERFPGVRLSLGGASEMESELLLGVLYGGALGLFAIYALMAIPLKSYLQPLIIMSVIPFGMIGALIGHLLVGIPFSALSLFGLVALAGVVVNDSIIMVDFINQSVDAGMKVRDAVLKAGSERFRPIMLTSLTTFFGLLPILLETSFSAQIVIPMAVSLGFGIMFATLITLVLIPCLYVMLDEFKQYWQAMGQGTPAIDSK